MQAFVPKNRRPKFDLRLTIIDLNNVPLVSGSAFVKWHLPSSTFAEHRGQTPKSLIKDHKVTWEYEKTLPVRLVIDRSGMLQGSEIHFEILQEYSAGGRGERIRLGNVKLDLAEYVEASAADSNEEGVTRRYLMQDSRINSTLKVCIFLKQIDGDRNFTAPPLKAAAVFDGIAGVLASEGAQEDVGQMPSIIQKSREIGEQQDVYRRTLAASWAMQADELPADECIENIFAGGDGWRPKDRVKKHHPAASADDTAEGSTDSDGESAHSYHSRRTSKQQTFIRGAQNKPRSRKDEGIVTATNNSQTGTGGKRKLYRSSFEVDEFDVREDLKSWSCG
ncbi:MAG: hypothetical protein M1819_006124 [Sarea resinae]|nr:MAG: hypothetical protein M1819_006124 [Sarea resinae]